MAIVIGESHGHDRNSRELLRASQNSMNPYQSKEYADFKFEKQQEAQVEIDLDKIDASVLDIDTS